MAAVGHCPLESDHCNYEKHNTHCSLIFFLTKYRAISDQNAPCEDLFYMVFCTLGSGGQAHLFESP